MDDEDAGDSGEDHEDDGEGLDNDSRHSIQETRML